MTDFDIAVDDGVNTGLIINYTPGDLLNTRFVINPMMTISVSASVAFNAHRHPLYAKWARYVAEALADVELPVLRDLTQGTEALPEFLAPLPGQADQSFEEDLNAIAWMGEDLLEAELAWLQDFDPPEANLKYYETRAQTMRERLIDELIVYWQRVIQPQWKQMRLVMQTDIMRLSHLLATEGHAQMFRRLSPQIEFSGERLRLVNHCVDMELDGDGGMLLAPNIFTRRVRRAFSLVNPGVMVVYPAQGAGNWRSQSRTTPSEALSLIVGQHRAALLYRLGAPITTSELATELHLTPGAISQQLGQLHGAGLVDKQRLGKRVYYRLNQRGERLLHVFESGG